MYYFIPDEEILIDNFFNLVVEGLAHALEQQPSIDLMTGLELTPNQLRILQQHLSEMLRKTVEITLIDDSPDERRVYHFQTIKKGMQ